MTVGTCRVRAVVWGRGSGVSRAVCGSRSALMLLIGFRRAPPSRAATPGCNRRLQTADVDRKQRGQDSLNSISAQQQEVRLRNNGHSGALHSSPRRSGRITRRRSRAQELPLAAGTPFAPGSCLPAALLVSAGVHDVSYADAAVRCVRCAEAHIEARRLTPG